MSALTDMTRSDMAQCMHRHCNCRNTGWGDAPLGGCESVPHGHHCGRARMQEQCACREECHKRVPLQWMHGNWLRTCTHAAVIDVILLVCRPNANFARVAPMQTMRYKQCGKALAHESLLACGCKCTCVPQRCTACKRFSQCAFCCVPIPTSLIACMNSLKGVSGAHLTA